jgi:hypothetical protein
MDGTTQIRHLPNVEVVEQTLANAATWFFPPIDVGGHPGFVTAQTDLTVWVRDAHHARHSDPTVPAAASLESDRGLSGSTLVDADTSTPLQSGETRTWLAPAPVAAPMRVLPVATLAPVDVVSGVGGVDDEPRPVFGLAVGSDQCSIFCGLELSGQVMELSLRLAPVPVLERRQRIQVFGTGSVSRLLVLDDMLLAASSIPMPDVSDPNESRLKILQRQPVAYPMPTGRTPATAANALSTINFDDDMFASDDEEETPGTLSCVRARV